MALKPLHLYAPQGCKPGKTKKQKLGAMTNEEFQAYVKAYAKEMTKLQVTWEKAAK